MIKFLQMAKELVKAGSATAEQKAEVKALFDALNADEKAVVQNDFDAVEALAESTKEDNTELVKAVGELIGPALKVEVEKFYTEANAKLNEFLADQKEMRAKKVGIFNPEIQEKRAVLNKTLRETLLAASRDDKDALLKLAGVSSEKELTTDSQNSPFGGYVTDRELSAEIRHLTTEYGVSRREMTTIQLSKNRYAANNLAADVTGYWVDEGAVIRSTQVVLGQEDLVLQKLGAIATITSELLQDEEVDLFDFIAGRVAETFARMEDDAFMNGDGTGTYGGFTGILQADDVNVVVMGEVAEEDASYNDTFFDLDADDLLDMQDASPQIISATGKYHMHRSIKNLIRKLKDSQGMPIYQQIAEAGPGTIWGRPIVEWEVMPSTADSDADTPFIVYGDLRRACILGTKGAIAVKRFDSGMVRNVANDADINLITTDREAIRWTERVGYIRILPSAITILKTATTES